MRRFRKVILAVGVSAAVAGLMLGLGVKPALASNTKLCAQAGYGYCLNNWNGQDYLGSSIKMGQNGWTTNNEFWVHHLVHACGGVGAMYGTSCINQWGTHGVDIAGSDIVSIADGLGGCLGSDASGNAVVGNCPDDNGNGGSFGTIFAYVDITPFGDPPQSQVVLYSRPWSQSAGALEQLASSGVVGQPALVNCYGNCSNVWGANGSREQ